LTVAEAYKLYGDRKPVVWFRDLIERNYRPEPWTMLRIRSNQLNLS